MLAMVLRVVLLLQLGAPVASSRMIISPAQGNASHSILDSPSVRDCPEANSNYTGLGVIMKNTSAAPAWERAIGLGNGGNTCFLAAAHQVLLHAPGALQYLLDPKHLHPDRLKARCGVPLPALQGLVQLYERTSSSSLSREVMAVLRRKLSHVDGMAEVTGEAFEQLDASEIIRAYFTAYDVETFTPPTALPTVLKSSVPKFTLSKFALAPRQDLFSGPNAANTLDSLTVQAEDELTISFEVHGLSEESKTSTLVSIGNCCRVDTEGGWVVFRIIDSAGSKVAALEKEGSRDLNARSFIVGGEHEIKIHRSCATLGPEQGRGEKRLLVYVDGFLAASEEDKTKHNLVKATDDLKSVTAVSELKVTVRKGRWGAKMEQVPNTRSADDGASAVRVEFMNQLNAANGDVHAKVDGGESISQKWAIHTFSKETGAYEWEGPQPSPDVVPTLQFPMQALFGDQSPVPISDLWPQLEPIVNLDWDRRVAIKDSAGEYSFMEAIHWSKGNTFVIPKRVCELILFVQRTTQVFSEQGTKINVPLKLRVASAYGDTYISADLPASAGTSGRSFEIRGCAVGGGMAGGHWWAFAKVGKEWYGFDDRSAYHVNSVTSIAEDRGKCRDAVLLYVAEFKPSLPLSPLGGAAISTTTSSSTAGATISASTTTTSSVGSEATAHFTSMYLGLWFLLSFAAASSNARTMI